jgi:hypothetical protein
MEDCARGLGRTQVRLASTQTALGFYRAAGYVEDGAPCVRRGTECHPLRKAL